MKNLGKKVHAFTLIELLAVVAVIGLCAGALFPAFARTKAPSQRIYCANNLRGIGQAFLIWGQDHGDAFPMRVSVANGGYGDFIGIRNVTTSSASRGVFGFYRCLSNELSSPQTLICPTENEPRLAANTFGIDSSPGLISLTNDLNVSYFLGIDAAETNPRALLAGDHNLGADGNLTPLRGFVTAPTVYFPDFKVSLGTNFVANAGVGWLNTMHSNQGNVGLADGSVHQYNRDQLQKALRTSGATQTAGGGPNFPNPVGCSGALLNRIQFP